MKDPFPPPGFRTWWDGSALFARLPDLVETGAHRLEPVLSGADARRLADIARGTGRPPAERLVLMSDPGYAESSVATFRDRLVAALVERGLETAVMIAREHDHASSRQPLALVDDEPIPAPPGETLAQDPARSAPVPKRRRAPSAPPGEGRPHLA